MKPTRLLNLLLVLALLLGSVPVARTAEPPQALDGRAATSASLNASSASSAVQDTPSMFNQHVRRFDAQATMHSTRDAENMEFVGHIGGRTSAVAVQGDYAYIGEGPRLTILDISNPTSLTVVGKTPPLPGPGPHNIHDVAVEGNYAYVVDGDSLRIIDVTTPTIPTEAGVYDMSGHYPTGVVVAGGYAYLVGSASYDGWLRVVDVSMPANPTEVGFYDTPGGAKDIAVAGDYAYIADHGAGLRVVDISNPANPREVGFYDTPEYAWGVAVAGNYAYVADGVDGLRVVDISNPVDPREVGFCDTVGYAWGVAVAGNYAYIVKGFPDFRVVDISNPANPTEVGFYDTPGGTVDVAVAGDYAYVADGWRGLRVVDISNPTKPMEVDFYDILGDTTNVAVAGNYAYVANGYGGLQVVDISTPASLTVVGFYDTPGSAEGVAVAGDYAYVADWIEGLRVIDISNPANPREVDFYGTPGYYTSDVVVAGGYIYIADDGAGLRVMDISNPANPTEVGFYNTPKSATGVAVAGDYAYVADGYGGLRVVDISNPANPTEVGFNDTLGKTGDVAVAGDYAYIAEDRYGLRVVDISNPANPTEVSFYDTSGATGVTVVGNYVYIAGGGLRVVDISDPTSPVEVGFYDTLSVSDVTVVEGYAYAASNGLLILRYTEAGSTYSVSGHVRDGNGNSISGVTVSTGTDGSATTDASGDYIITGVMTGTYTFTPSRSGYTFSPSTRTVSVPPDATEQDFLGSLLTRADLTIYGLEITQAIQCFNSDDPECPDNSVPLVEDKPTLVRVYVDNGEATVFEGPPGVTGILTVTFDGGAQTRTLTPINPGKSIHAPSVYRERANDTLNFLLPQETLEGTITLVAEINPDCTVLETNCGNNQSEPKDIEFHERKMLVVRYVPIVTMGDLPQLWVGPSEAIHTADAWMRKVYPLAQGTTGLKYIAEPGLRWYCPTWLPGCTTRLLNELEKRWQQNSDADLYIGFLPETTFSVKDASGSYTGIVGGVCPLESHACLVSDDPDYDIKFVLAHEIGHSYGLCHPDDTSPVCEGRRPPRLIEEVGWDTSADIVSGIKWFDQEGQVLQDFMNAGGSTNNRWVSPYTYKRLYERFGSDQSLELLSKSGVERKLLITGQVDSANSGAIFPAYRYTTTRAIDSSDQGAYSLEILDHEKAILYTFRFDPHPIKGAESVTSSTGLFSAILPDFPNMSTLRLKHSSIVLDEHQVSAHTPVVTVTAPSGAEIVSGVYTVTWAVSDADGDDLTYAVLYSPDDGTTWQPLATSITATLYALDTDWIAGSDNARIRVLATDGLNTASDETNGVFTVPKKAPSVYITQPEDGTHFLPGEPVILMGRGYDYEDGTLDPSLSWTSNISGTLGIGAWLQLDAGLPPGEHIINLSAEDSDGNVETTSIEISVSRRLFLPLIFKDH